MNDYRECLPFLRSELVKLEQPELHLSAEIILEVMAAEGSPEADAAVLQYADTLLWPPLADRVRFELCLRLRCAIWQIESLNDSTCDQDTLQAVLTGNMIDYWRDVGRTDYLSNELIYRDDVI
jgi:hypothetical protein